MGDFLHVSVSVGLLIGRPFLLLCSYFQISVSYRMKCHCKQLYFQAMKFGFAAFPDNVAFPDYETAKNFTDALLQ